MVDYLDALFGLQPQPSSAPKRLRRRDRTQNRNQRLVRVEKSPEGCRVYYIDFAPTSKR